MKLYEIQHPYYGAADYNLQELEDFAHLRGYLNALDEDMNFIYRWDWIKETPEDCFAGETPREYLLICFVMPRKERLGAVQCPITADQESEVREWLNGPRVLGALRSWWAPLLDNVGHEQLALWDS